MRFGDPLFFYSAQRNWQREATDPFVTATRAWKTAVDGLNIFANPGSGTVPLSGPWRTFWNVLTAYTTLLS
jgi:hypothetical protein